jgi:hypothetical protein
VKLNKIESLRPIRGVIKDKSQIKGLKCNWQKNTVHLCKTPVKNFKKKKEERAR